MSRYFSGLTNRADVQDTDHFVGYRTAAAGGSGRWTALVLKTWIQSWLTKALVGLSNADNTSDADKPLSSAAVAALAAKAAAADLTTHTGNTSNPHSVTKAQVGLGSVDNSADSAKPVSTAQQAAIDALGVRYLHTVSGSTGGGAGNLDGQNAGVAGIPVNTLVFLVDGSRWVAQAGTNATEVAAGWCRPANYNASTNAVVFARLG